ncbi:MAG: cobalamin biosynthesis protein CbiA [Candidatus Zixiibacteriota bacterium]|nr:MAG: cobalamin biosynthesis protein CbiA [candidate division Zixibacteria bacterium]
MTDGNKEDVTTAMKIITPDTLKRIIVIAGGYGSGKSEVAVNLAKLFAEQGETVTLADVDLVNPYFRSREAAKVLEARGIRCIIPPGDQIQADLPIVLPEIKGAVQQSDGVVILDVGGDDVGSRVLSSLADGFTPGSYDLLLVLNKNRPFTADVPGTLKVMKEIEDASKLTFTGIVANTHLLDSTDVNDIVTGIAHARDVAKASGLPVAFVSGLADIVQDLPAAEAEVPVLPLERELLKPWERKGATRTT